jgi:mannose-1-phosphate guanylyltransferase
VTEAILLVGGKGTRLRPLTVRTPKPMVRAAGVPFLTHQLARAKAAGVEHIVLATSYLAEVFEPYFGDGSSLGLHLEYVTEDAPLGTGGGIRNVADRLRGEPGDAVLVLNGDVLSGHDLTAQLAAHELAGADVTLHLVRVADPRAFGCVPTDQRGRVTAFLEKMPEPVSDQINAGAYVFRRKVIDAIPPDRVVSVERDTFPGLLAAGALVLGHVDEAYWLDVGSPAALVRASADVVLGRLPSSAIPGPTGEALILDGAHVDPGARVTGGTVVHPGVRVAAGAVVDGSLLLPGAQVGADAWLARCAIGVDARIGPRCKLEDVVVGDGARLGADNQLRAGARVWNSVTLSDGALRF